MNKHLTFILALFTFVGCSTANDGMPFGRITENDAVQLVQFAQNQGLDLDSESMKAYAKDKNALARIFRLSLAFKSFDQNAKTYGQVVFSSFLRLGESMGVKEYSNVLTAQEPAVRQRIRDFLFYPMTLVPQNEKVEVEKEVREDYPELFPKDYHFGKGDPIFNKKAYRAEMTTPRKPSD